MRNVIGRLAIEIGGTFTDVVLVIETEQGIKVNTFKLPSSRSHPEQPVVQAIDSMDIAPSELEEFLHGSTVGTNTVVERRGAQSCLVTTKGFGDILEMQRGDKEVIYSLLYKRPEPLIQRSHVYEADERIDRYGVVLNPLTDQDISEIVEQIRAVAPQSVAVSLLHSYANPEHEKRLYDAITTALPEVNVVLSSDTAPQFREYERTSTTVMSAYVSPVVGAYLRSLEKALKDRGFTGSFNVTQSNGGVMSCDLACRQSVWTLLSGPAAGVSGATRLASTSGYRNLITFDMGGTSTDVCLVEDGKPQLSSEYKVDGLTVALPMIDVVTVGAGGGSIAWKDEGGMLCVGPQSAGSVPGPASYGRGGTAATITDANVLKGIIRAKRSIGGDLRLSVERARDALAQAGAEFGQDPLEFAESIVRVANNNIAQATRLVSTYRGKDPRDYTLVAYGGAGPLHAAFVAEELDIPRVLVPIHAGIVSALGLMLADFRRDYAHTRVIELVEGSMEELRTEFRNLEQDARDELGISSDSGVTIQRCVDARYRGQGYELTIDLTGDEKSAAEIAALFNEAYANRYGYADQGQMIEIVTCRLSCVQRRDVVSPDILRFESRKGQVETAPVWHGGHWIDCCFYERADLGVGDSVRGMAVIEEATSATVVPPGWQARVDESGHLVITREGRQ